MTANRQDVPVSTDHQENEDKNPFEFTSVEECPMCAEFLEITMDFREEESEIVCPACGATLFAQVVYYIALTQE